MDLQGLGLILILIGAELLAEGLVKLNSGMESVETPVMALYVILALVLFFKRDLVKLVRKTA